MLKTNISKNKQANSPYELGHFTNTTFELVKWPSVYSDTSIAFDVSENILAIQTTRLSPLNDTHVNINGSPFDAFNLGLHVGDNSEHIIQNRDTLMQFINQQLSTQNSHDINSIDCVKIQWLDQVHGNTVVTISSIDNQPLVADACITSEKNIALAIMTADCLPILLSNKKGTEIAAIHGGWRPLAANIVANTIEQMKSEPSDIIAWLGPCIGKDSFEVGREVKEQFVQLDAAFESAFVQKFIQQDAAPTNYSKQNTLHSNSLAQVKVKYLADLHQIACVQLTSLGVMEISSLPQCTYQNTDKYYSYRKENITGRMASIICRR